MPYCIRDRKRGHPKTPSSTSASLTQGRGARDSGNVELKQGSGLCLTLSGFLRVEASQKETSIPAQAFFRRQGGFTRPAQHTHVSPISPPLCGSHWGAGPNFRQEHCSLQDCIAIRSSSEHTSFPNPEQFLERLESIPTRNNSTTSSYGNVSSASFCFMWHRRRSLKNPHVRGRADQPSASRTRPGESGGFSCFAPETS